MARAQYVRLYADADGESHFLDEEMELRSVNFAPPAPPLNVSAFTANEAICAPLRTSRLGR